MKVTDEQLREIGAAGIYGMLGLLPKGITWVHEGKGDERSAKIACGRAAFEASVRIALAEPTKEEWETALQDVTNADNDSIRNLRPFNGPMTHEVARHIFANRLRSLTEPERDEAVEAVRALFRNEDWRKETFLSLTEKMVAIVRKVDLK